MPELPEVETIKSAICQSIGNCNIKDIIVNNNRLREKFPTISAAKSVVRPFWAIGESPNTSSLT